MQQYKPSGGFRKLSLSLLRQLKKILVSCADPSHPTYVNVNFMSKSHAHMQFVVMIPFLPLYRYCLSTGMTTGTRTPSILPMQL